jgi:hypothetical protein
MVVKLHKPSMLVLERAQQLYFQENVPISIKQTEKSSKVVVDMVVH